MQRPNILYGTFLIIYPVQRLWSATSSFQRTRFRVNAACCRCAIAMQRFVEAGSSGAESRSLLLLPKAGGAALCSALAAYTAIILCHIQYSNCRAQRARSNALCFVPIRLLVAEQW